MGFVNSKKGLTMATVLIIASLMLFLSLGPLIKYSADAAVKRSVQFQTEQAASVVNFLQSAPDVTFQALTLQKGKCSVSFNQMYIEFELNDEKSQADIIQTGLKIPEKEIGCSENEQKTICVVKRRGRIDIFERTFDCLTDKLID